MYRRSYRISSRTKSIVGLLVLLACAMAGAWALSLYRQPVPRSQALIRAVKAGDAETCRRLLAQGLNPNATDAEPVRERLPTSLEGFCARMVHPVLPESALAVALAYDRNEKQHPDEPIVIVDALLDAGADPRGTCSNSEPVICRAVCLDALAGHSVYLCVRAPVK